VSTTEPPTPRHTHGLTWSSASSLDPPTPTNKVPPTPTNKVPPYACALGRARAALTRRRGRAARARLRRGVAAKAQGAVRGEERAALQRVRRRGRTVAPAAGAGAAGAAEAHEVEALGEQNWHVLAGRSAALRRRRGRGGKFAAAQPSNPACWAADRHKKRGWPPST
jgi:hypothetical protein